MQVRVTDTGTPHPPDGVGNAMGLCGGTSRAMSGSIDYPKPAIRCSMVRLALCLPLPPPSPALSAQA